jgi:hypothetical protein
VPFCVCASAPNDASVHFPCGLFERTLLFSQKNIEEE